MSRASVRPPGSSPAPGAPARAGALVAVLERRGRFLTAEPLFPPREGRGAPRGRGASARVVVGPGRSGSGGGIRAGAGDLVLVERSARGSGGRVVRVLGRPDIARDVIEGLMLDRGLRRGFDEAVEREAAGAADASRSHPSRRDLRALATFTIDPAGARDFDDAISAEAAGGDRTRVWVHIADVCAHVAEGSLLDREARRRATSVYVPSAVEPMLPHALSSNACSLAPGVDRPAVTVELELHGAITARAAFYRSMIRSDERLDYERVDRIFAGSEEATEPWRAPLSAAREAAAALARARELSGALVLDSEEPEFSFDEHGNVAAIERRSQTESHRLIEHLMIAANEAVAGLLSQRSVPCLYRVHERPDPDRIERLADQLASLEVPTPPLPENMSSSQAAELVGEISRLVDAHVRRTGSGRTALSSLVLRSLKQAYYSPTNLGHAGLRSERYCHFTSPIRRYPDLVCHRALLSACGEREREPRAGELLELGVWTSEREREAMVIERDADDVARCFALEKVLYEGGFGQTFVGEVTGMISSGLFVAFGEAEGEEHQDGVRAATAEGSAVLQRPGQAFEGMLPVRLLRAPERGGARPRTRGGRGRSGGRGRAGEGGEAAREWWELGEHGTIMQAERSGATVRLGDRIEVRVARVDRVAGRVDLTPAG